MRRVFLPMISLQDARDAAPWACALARVAGGWLAFASLGDYRTWARQRHQEP